MVLSASASVGHNEYMRGISFQCTYNLTKSLNVLIFFLLDLPLMIVKVWKVFVYWTILQRKSNTPRRSMDR